MAIRSDVTFSFSNSSSRMKLQIVRRYLLLFNCNLHSDNCECKVETHMMFIYIAISQRRLIAFVIVIFIGKPISFNQSKFRLYSVDFKKFNLFEIREYCIRGFYLISFSILEFLQRKKVAGFFINFSI